MTKFSRVQNWFFFNILMKNFQIFEGEKIENIRFTRNFLFYNILIN